VCIHLTGGKQWGTLHPHCKRSIIEMSEKNALFPYVITISRQLGSGGAFLGRQLASQLGIAYADREILERAAEVLEVQADDIEPRDECPPSLIESMLQSFTFAVPEANYAPPLRVPGYEELRQAETGVIVEIASVRDAVIVGRGGFHLLKGHPLHISVFLHATTEFRQRRVQEIYSLSPQQALHTIQESDHARSRYLRDLTGRSWTDTTQYDISLCTSSLGLMLAERVLFELVRTRFRGCGKNGCGGKRSHS
jgi:CMP/dCMP kinase